MLRLGINIDHVATVRQARGETYPDPVQAAVLAELGGADNITCHLREDRRHVQDRDVELLRRTIQVPLNFEIAATDFMIDLACRLKPHAVTLVPEKREELTTEGGLDIARAKEPLKAAVARLNGARILVSMFIEPDRKAVDLSREIGAGAVEFHTGRFCKEVDHAPTTKAKLAAVRTLAAASEHARSAGLQSHFGHGLHYGNAQWLQLVPHAEEANIGHAVIARAIFVGLDRAVREMKALLNDPQHKPYVPDDLV
jgi:pyridoxine 5-phosphate synthase